MMDKQEKRNGEGESEKEGHVLRGISGVPRTRMHQQTCGDLPDPNFLLIKATRQEVNADAKEEENKSLKVHSPLQKSILSSFASVHHHNGFEKESSWCD